MNQGLATAAMSQEDAAMSRQDGGFEGDPASDSVKDNYRTAPAADPSPDRLIVQPAAQPLACPRSSNLRILAVDDDPLVLMNVTALLEDLGHSVIEAQSGKAALEVLRGGQGIDLLVTDQSMPGMTGVELAAAASDAVPGIRIVIATGYTELPASNVRFVTLQKPFLDDDLSRAIDKAMNGQD
jgi:CheY-like chemotaxis protein